VIPYLGLYLGNLDPGLGPGELLGRGGELLSPVYPTLYALAALWAAMALLVAVAEWAGVWVLGLALAVGGGALGYALEVSATQEALAQAMTSLGLAAIIYGVVKYLGSRLGG
jgi:eukaryotic-like serine/threonine-protein kinase